LEACKWISRKMVSSDLKKPENLYISIAVLFGILFMFISPPCGTPDEPAHLLRVFRVSQGHFFKAASVALPPMDSYCSLCDLAGITNVPQRMGGKVLDFVKEPASATIAYEMASGYPPVPYIPAAVIFKVLSLFSPSMAFYLYAGRLVTLIASLFITWHAIRIIPSGKWIMVVLALMPMRLYQAASISADSVTTALVALFIAIVVNLVVNRSAAMPAGKLSLLFLVSILLLFSKPMYLFLFLLLLAIPLDVGRHRLKMALALSLLGCLALFKVWGTCLFLQD
jgi:uncharacterized membrane protein